MQIKALSLFSVFLAIILTIVATVQGAPAPTETPEAPTSTSDAETSPSATAGASPSATKDASLSVPFSAVNPEDDSDTQSGQARRVPKNKTQSKLQASLECWDAYISGRQFSITCSGSRWYEWTDCSNGYRYQAGPVSGTYRGTITCPYGYRALRGGAFGY
ncbi:hypothetical protein BGZ70_000337 [Mortierella alpina]|uniref:Uncharacterized protein n=1 Tax=Mortierella alpina TaxID=64518 RepID=A0A9P6J1A4_MORAP|nr:hypothetical protein BGZ70_000337 [Mortierella alpina]